MSLKIYFSSSDVTPLIVMAVFGGLVTGAFQILETQQCVNLFSCKKIQLVSFIRWSRRTGRFVGM